MPPYNDHPDFTAACEITRTEGACGRIDVHGTATVMVPRGDGIVCVTGLRLDRPTQSITRILQGAHR